MGHSDVLKVKRHVKGENSRDTIDGTHAQKDYVTYFNAVDRNDRDSADYSTSIRTARYYLRIFFWILDRAVHATYVVVCYLLHLPIGKEWKKYRSKNSGRHDFQIDLGIAILNYAISLEWDGNSKRRLIFTHVIVRSVTSASMGIQLVSTIRGRGKLLLSINVEQG